VFVLTAAGLLLRAYALNELPAGFDSETVSSMIESRTAWGIRRYFDSSFLTTAPGMIHILTQRATFALFGTSPYSVRLASLLWGVAAVPLFYWLMRRIAGRAPATFMTAIFVVAPEQLYWSRTENAFFGPVSVLAIITTHLGLGMVERLSLRATLAAALWMPVCRFFYIPSFVLFVYPLALFAHALLFVRRAWRKAWYAVPVLAAGIGLWFYGLSIMVNTTSASSVTRASFAQASAPISAASSVATGVCASKTAVTV
jgi:4-amino-4-deoxy-L-arabinose transferase-like glycosyltransferase